MFFPKSNPINPRNQTHKITTQNRILIIISQSLSLYITTQNCGRGDSQGGKRRRRRVVVGDNTVDPNDDVVDLRDERVEAA